MTPFIVFKIWVIKLSEQFKSCDLRNYKIVRDVLIKSRKYYDL